MTDSFQKFVEEIYPRICAEAYKLGVKAKNDGLPRICNLCSEPYITPSGNVLKVYKEVWESGWDNWPTNN